MQELVRKINDGRYKVESEQEPIYIETCLFMLDCLQTIEENRKNIQELGDSPLISPEFAGYELH